MADECASVSIKYKGDGSRVLFPFTFTYMAYSDIVCFLYNETTKTWVNQENKFIFANATTVEFLTAPPAPTEDIENVWITRSTDLEQMVAIFYPGSSIRAQDLNDDFDQLRLAIQESKCDLQDYAENLDNDFVAKDKVFDRPDQEAGKWDGNGDQEYLATSGAIAARSDTIVRDDLPPTPAYQQPGKGWQNTDDCWSSYWNPQANAWVAYVNTGPRGIPGQDGASADVQIGETTTGAPGTNAEVIDSGENNVAVLNFTIPRGDKGEPGTGINVTGYIDEPGPPSFDGTGTGDYVIDSNGVGWFWETDTDPATWVDTGTIRGPEGPEGPAGQDGAAGSAATIAVDNTVTGPPGSDASVINVGTSSAASLVFTIPKGEKGDPGQNGTGAGTVTDVTVTGPLTVISPQGPVVELGFDMSLLPVLP